ncbi:MAG: HAMP domain-containing protein [Actinobacteria bacterium]|nr:HAMP domain-containing protein [Actinomycetota bacterium]
MAVANVDKKKQRRKTRLKISFQITGIVLLIFVIASAVGFVFFRGSLNELTQNSKDKILDSVGKLVSESHNFTSSYLINVEVMRLKTDDPTQLSSELEQAKADGKPMPSQQAGTAFLKDLVDSGIMGITTACYVLPPTEGLNDKPIIIGSSNDGLLYREIPEELLEIATGDSAQYKFFEDGIEALGLDGEYLVSSYQIEQPDSEGALWYLDFKPMGDLISDIDAFYQKENQRAYLLLGIVVGSSILGFIIISFLVLGYLIKKRILNPIDELSEAAEKVVEGDMSVRVGIKPQEEFWELKKVFNDMISSLDKIIHKKFGSENAYEEAGGSSKAGKIRRSRFKPKSMMLVEVVALFTVLFVLSGVASLLVVNMSMNNYSKKSQDILIETEAALIDSSHEFGLKLVMIANPIASQPENSQEQMQEFIRAFNNKEISYIQEEGSQLLGNMVKYSLFGFVLVYDVLPPSPLTSDYTVVISSDLNFIYSTPPEEVIKMLEKEEDSYQLFENGFPEMGLDGAYLVTTFKFGETPGSPLYFWSVEYRPMEEELADIESFYQQESRKLTWTMVLVVVICLIAMSLITYFSLGYLIKKQITEPIDELVVVSREVMEGDLDVEVTVRPGEEFEGLKKAFNQMITTLRDLVEKSTGQKA